MSFCTLTQLAVQEIAKQLMTTDGVYAEQFSQHLPKLFQKDFHMEIFNYCVNTVVKQCANDIRGSFFLRTVETIYNVFERPSSYNGVKQILLKLKCYTKTESIFLQHLYIQQGEKNWRNFLETLFYHSPSALDIFLTRYFDLLSCILTDKPYEELKVESNLLRMLLFNYPKRLAVEQISRNLRAIKLEYYENENETRCVQCYEYLMSLLIADELREMSCGQLVIKIDIEEDRSDDDTTDDTDDHDGNDDGNEDRDDSNEEEEVVEEAAEKDEKDEKNEQDDDDDDENEEAKEDEQHDPLNELNEIDDEHLLNLYNYYADEDDDDYPGRIRKPMVYMEKLFKVNESKMDLTYSYLMYLQRDVDRYSCSSCSKSFVRFYRK